MSEAAIPPQRGSFYGTYAIPTERRDKRRKFPRLRECIVCIAQTGDPEYLTAPDEGEFAVVDTATQEKAWLEIPAGATAENLGRDDRRLLRCPSFAGSAVAVGRLNAGCPS